MVKSKSDSARSIRGFRTHSRFHRQIDYARNLPVVVAWVRNAWESDLV